MQIEAKRREREEQHLFLTAKVIYTCTLITENVTSWVTIDHH